MRTVGSVVLIVVISLAIGGLVKVFWPRHATPISAAPDWYKQYPVVKRPTDCDPKGPDAWYKCDPKAK